MNVDIEPILSRIQPPWWRGVSVVEWWYPILLELDSQLAKIDPNYEVHQVKAKFGCLRYYCSLDGLPEAIELIREADDKIWKLEQERARNE